jgi:hypothetical protein
LFVSYVWMMTLAPLKALTKAIARNPWSTLQDGLLIAMAMVVAFLLALEYDLFSFIEELSEPQRKISLAEAIFLTALPCGVDRHFHYASFAGRAPRRRASDQHKEAAGAVEEAGVAGFFD